MIKYGHGGDVLSAKERIGSQVKRILDFSANINPLGLPEAVAQAVTDCLTDCCHYPDPFCRKLVEGIAKWEGVQPHQVLCGNGAADLIFRLVLACRPQRALVAVPTFSEYEQALRACGCPVEQHLLRRESGFVLEEDFLERLCPGVGMVFLCNPNNPTGQLIPLDLLRKIAQRCREIGAVLVLDECFNDFLDQPDAWTMKPYLAEFPNLVILKAFTKLYAMPGLRLGYCLCAGEELLDGAAACGQPWSVSTPAQAAGLAALDQEDYRCRTARWIAQERPFLRQGLEQLGLAVTGSQANYIFFRAPCQDLPQRLEPLGILVRSCANYPGLDEQDCRVAVRSREENQQLLAALGQVLARSYSE